MEQKQTIRNLNTALQMEITATHQYQLHAQVLDDWGLPGLAEMMRQEQAEETEHSDRFLDRILFLGGEPEVAFEKAPVRATSLREMFEADLKDEENASRLYTNIQRRRRKPAPKVTSVRGCSLSRLCSTRKATRPGSRPSST